MESSKLADDRASVVVCHDVLWTYHDIVPCFDRFSFGKAYCILLNDLFDDGLGYSVLFDSGCK